MNTDWSVCIVILTGISQRNITAEILACVHLCGCACSHVLKSTICTETELPSHNCYLNWINTEAGHLNAVTTIIKLAQLSACSCSFFSFCLKIAAVWQRFCQDSWLHQTCKTQSPKSAQCRGIQQSHAQVLAMLQHNVQEQCSTNQTTKATGQINFGCMITEITSD